LKILPLLIAALSGVTMAVQGTLNSALSKIVGLWETTFIVHGTGVLLAAALLFIFKVGDGSLAQASQAPWYTFLGGALGIVITYAVAKSIPQIGAAPATTAIVLAQVLAAALLDHLGLFGLKKVPFDYYSLIGTLMMAGGAWLILKH